MAVLDLQAWADATEAVRLPQIEADITALDVLLTQTSQTITDTLDAHSFRIDEAQVDADAGKASAAVALSNIYQTGIDATTYTDEEIQKLKDWYQAKLDLLQTSIEGNLTTLLNANINSVIPNFTAEHVLRLAEIEAIKTYIDGQTTDLNQAIFDMINVVLPGFFGQIEGIEDAQNLLDISINDLLAGYTYGSLQEGIDDFRDKAQKDLVPLTGSSLHVPRSLWGKDLELSSATLAKSTLGNYGTFVVADADFGEAFEFADGTNTNLGPAQPIEFDPERVYKIQVKFKAIDDGTGNGCRVRIGAVAQTGTTLDANEEVSPTIDYVTINQGVRTLNVYVSANTVKMDDYGLVVSERIDLTAPTSNKLYLYIRQNYFGSTSGRLSIGSIEILDVTETFDGVNAVRTFLTDEVDGVYAHLDVTYRTMVDEDIAIAQAVTDLKTTMEDPNGSSIGATLNQNYYTQTESDAAISAQVNVLKAQIEDPNGSSIGALLLTDYRTTVDADSAVATQLNVLKAQMEDPNGTSVGSTIASVSTVATNANNLANTANNTAATAASVSNSINSNFGGQGASASSFASTMITLDGKVNSGYWLKATANNVTAGLQLYSNGSTSTINLDADNILINGTVVTGLLENNAATVPEADSKVDPTLYGNGNFVTANTKDITMSVSGKVMIVWSGAQGYNNDYEWDVYLAINGTVCIGSNRGGTATIDAPGTSWAGTLSAGTHTIKAMWKGEGNGLDNSSLELSSRTLAIFGAKK